MISSSSSESTSIVAVVMRSSRVLFVSLFSAESFLLRPFSPLECLGYQNSFGNFSLLFSLAFLFSCFLSFVIINTHRRTEDRMRRRFQSFSSSAFKSALFLFFFVFFFVSSFSSLNSVEAAASLKANGKKGEEKELFGLHKKWSKPCVACTREKGAWCDNGRDGFRGCIEKPNFLNTLMCKRVVRCKKGCTPLRDLMESFCKKHDGICSKYDLVKRALIGETGKKKK